MFKKHRLLLLCFTYIMSSGFINPTDIIYNNINLIPDTTDKKNNNYPHISQHFLNAKSEKIFPQLKLPEITSGNPAENFSIKKILKLVITDLSPKNIIENIKQTESTETPIDGLKYILNIPNVNDSIKLNYIENEASELPILNTLPSFPYLYNETPIVENIDDIKIKGLDNVLTIKTGDAVEPEKYIQSNINFFTDFITPEDTLSKNIIDTIP